MTDWIKSVRISQNLSEKMRSAKVEFDRSLITEGEEFFEDISITIPDYNATQRYVLSGIYSSSLATYKANGELESVTAYDRAWYLTMQYLKGSQMSLLTSAHQLAQKKYYQEFVKNPGEWPIIKVGDIVVGETSDAMGLVYEVNYAGQDWFKMDNISGTGYQDEENLLVNGVNIAHSIAYGVSMDITGAITPKTPEDFITEMLLRTGIDPYKINSTSGIWGGTKPEIDFLFPQKTTKRSGADKICKYLEFILLIKSTSSGSRGYFVANDDIDDPTDGLDLPAPVTIYAGAGTPTTITSDITDVAVTIPVAELSVFPAAPYSAKIGGSERILYLAKSAASGPGNLTSVSRGWGGTEKSAWGSGEAIVRDRDLYLVSPVTQESRGEERYNSVTVKCQSLSGQWFTSVKETAAVMAETEDPIEYYEINTEIASQEEADDRCEDLFAYYSAQINTWRATFRLRSDFELLQKLTFSGYGPQIPDDTYRIIGIDCDYSNGGVRNQVVCTLVADDQFESYLNLSRVFTDTISETQAVIQDALDRLGEEAGVVTAISGSTVTVLTESGRTVITRK